MEIKGNIKLINPRQDVSASFSKREVVVTTSEQYPQHILIEFNQDKCDYLDKYTVGQAVIISINLRGREWVNPEGESKYFNTIQGWRIEADSQQPTSNQSAPPPAAAAPPASGKQYVHTATFSLQDALAKNWTYDALVAGGHGHWKENAPVAAPSAMPNAPEPNDDLPFN